MKRRKSIKMLNKKKENKKEIKMKDLIKKVNEKKKKRL